MNMLAQPLILLWTRHPGDLLGAAITALTHGPAQHAGFLRRDGVTVHEAYYPKVRERVLTEAEKPFIRCFTLEGMTPALADRFERFFTLSASQTFAADYSVAGLFGYLFNVAPPDEASVFCSEYAMQTVRKLAPDRLPLVRCEDWTVSPRDLLVSPRLVEVAWADVAASVQTSVPI